MRSLKILAPVLLAIVGALGIAGMAAGQALEDVSAPSPPGAPPNFNVPMWDGPDVVLYDNGPLVTHPGGGAGGADASAVQTALGNTTYGFGHAISSGFRMADDFTVPAGGWLITQVTFFAYQTGSTTTSTINNVNLRIWNGPPNAGGSVIWGDTTTNVLAASQWSTIYRVLDTGLLDTARPIMADTVTVGTVLPAGIYWLDWQTGGTLSSGPWAPPVTILGQTAKPGSNGLQYNPTTATWGPALDGTFQQDLPFIVEGTGASGPSISLAKTVGTDPGVCATTSAITVVAGTTVYYCYEVTNTGDVTFTAHDLVDDQLGTIFTGLSYSLAPGASVNTVQAGLSIPAVMNNTTTNTGTWTASVVGGPSAQATDTATVTVEESRCPAGYFEVELTAADFEGTFPPAGWAVANSTTGCGAVPEWTNTDPGARGNLTGGVGLFAIADSDACGSSSVMNTDMRTPILDLTGMIDPLVAYWTDYNDIATGGDIATLEVSTDGGGSWVSVLTWDEDHRGPLFVEQAIPGAGDNDVMIRWNYTNATWDWWWEVDDVVVTACVSGVMPEPLVCNGPTVTFDAGPPGDWTVIDNAGNGVVWTSIAGSGETGNYTNGSGDAASVSSDAFGAAEFDTELRTPPFDTTGQFYVQLSYTANYQNFANLDYLDVDVSTNGGSTWTTVLSWNEDHGAFRSTPGEDVLVDISAVAGNQPSVIVRWRYYDPNTNDYDWYAQIDNAALACDIPVELMSFSVE